MYKGSHVLGKKIVVYDTGEQIAWVKDLIFDHQSNRVLGLLVDEGGWFSNAQVIAMESVQLIGPDSVIVSAKDAIINAEQSPEIQAILNQKNILKNTKIMTVGGQDLGTCLDLYFDEQTWTLAGYEVSGGLFADIYSGRSFVPAPLTLKIGQDYAFVENEVADRMKEHSGGLEAVVDATGEKLQTLTESTGEKLQTARQATGEKLHAVTEAAGKRFETLRQATGSTLQGTVDKTTETVQRVLPHPSIEQAKGRRVQRAIQTETGLYVAAPGQIVTEAVIDKARQQHQEAALMEAVGLTVGEVIRTDVQERLVQSGEALKKGTQKVGERLSAGVEEVKTGAQTLWDKTKERTTELQAETAEAIESRRIQNALGRRVDRTILDEQDNILLKEGEIITHKAVEQAKAAGVLPMLLNSADGSVTSETKPPQPIAEAGPE